MKLKVYTIDGANFNEKQYDRFPILEEDKGIASLQYVVQAYLANARQGSACTKDRSEVRGGSRKPWKQKHTGNARHGSRRSPIWAGGGVAHGPKPRDYSKKINRKEKQLAFKRALLQVASEGNLNIIEQFKIQQPKTQVFNQVLNRIFPIGKVLIVDDSFQDNTLLAARNIERLYLCEATSLNCWDLIRYNNILMSDKGLEIVLSRINA
jgi:large subunit ribosomal protein L4